MPPTNIPLRPLSLSLMPHVNPNMPTHPFSGFWAAESKPLPPSPDSVMSQSPPPEPPLPITPPLTHAGKGLLRAMRRLVELLVDTTFIIEEAPDGASTASKEEITSLLREAQHYSQQTLDKAVEGQIVLLLRDVSDPNLSPQRKEVHGTPIYDATTHVGTHPANSSPQRYNPRLEPSAAQQYHSKVVLEREAREAKASAYWQLAQARAGMEQAMGAWIQLAKSFPPTNRALGGMRHVHECVNAEPPPANVHEHLVQMYEELATQHEIIGAAAAQIAREQTLPAPEEAALRSRMLARIQQKLSALHVQLQRAEGVAHDDGRAPSHGEAHSDRRAMRGGWVGEPDSPHTDEQPRHRHSASTPPRPSPVPFGVRFDDAPSTFELGPSRPLPPAGPGRVSASDPWPSPWNPPPADMPTNAEREVAMRAAARATYRAEAEAAASDAVASEDWGGAVAAAARARPPPPSPLRRSLSKSSTSLGHSLSDLFSTSMGSLRCARRRSKTGRAGVRHPPCAHKPAVRSSPICGQRCPASLARWRWGRDARGQPEPSTRRSLLVGWAAHASGRSATRCRHGQLGLREPPR